ncbi:HD domain-containing protein [Allohahella sp. A8]|uniref:HD domain-containing protein n=1 Tax=Allohahella sp. A8 TaxID=3141461 RepID=UPI003A81280D
MMHTRSSPRFELLGLRDRLIMDPVHGGIALSEIEVAIIDHPLFQRLRYICQNDILSLVFPGATHSRFLHSIGTMHVGHRIFSQLLENALAERVKQHGQAYDLSESQLGALHFFTQIVRLACLLHDCGHSSFSHQFSRAESIHKLFADGKAVKTLWEGIDTTKLFGRPPEKIVHEHFSVRCAMAIFQDSLPASADFTMDDVLCLMETTAIQPSEAFMAATAAIWPVLTGDAEGTLSSQDALDNAARHLIETLGLVVSGEFDADRADYMLRDGFHSSVTIGGFNIDHLLKNLHIGWDSKANWMGFAVTGNGLGALEDFVYSRYQMYRKVYGHKTSQGFDLILKHAINEVMADSEVSDFVYDCLTDIQEFRHLTDNYFWEQFRRFARTNPNSWSERIINRRRLKHLRTVQDADAETLKTLSRTLDDELGIEAGNGVLHCTLKARFSKIGSGYREIRVLNKRTGTYSDITHQSDFFSKFRDVSITHFYREP